MFCDLVGSTLVSERLDPESLREFLLAYQAYCSEIIERFGGHVARYMGDGVLAYFGYPQAREDDARRAALAALELVESVQTLEGRVSSLTDIRPALRVGLHTGLVVVAEMGAGQRREPHDVVGEAPNVAARLQTLAEPDTVVLSAATYELVRGYVEVVHLGQHQLKGITRPLELFRLRRKAEAESRLQAVRPRTRLVDREEERRLLLESWERARAGSVEVVSIEGDAGIGKSRLVEFLTDHVTRAGSCYLVLQCSPHHVNTMFHPVVRLIERAAGLGSDDSSTQWERLRAFLEGFGPMSTEDLSLFAALVGVPLPAHAADPELTPEHRREQTFQAVLTWLRRMAAASPLVLAVEDAHWADPSTVELIGRIAGAAAQRTMTVLTMRPEGRVRTEAEVVTLRLHPLERNDRVRMVHSLTEDLHVPSTLRDVIVQRSDGIPLYIEELARMLARADVLEAAAGGPGGPGGIDIPTTLHDLLIARVEQYPEGKQVAQVIATIGQPAPLSLLVRLVDQTEAFLRRQLNALVDGGILQVDPAPVEDRYGFRHALIRDAAYQLQLRRRRQELHAVIADTIERSFPEMAQGQPELVARHHLEGGHLLRAAECWYRAGGRASDLAAHTEAIEHYRRALAVMADMPPDEVPTHLQVSAQTALGASLLVMRGYTAPEVEQTYARAVELSGQQPDVLSTLGLWSYYMVRGDHAIASRMATQALEAAALDSELVVGHGLVGYQACFAGDFEAARRHLEEAVARRGSGDIVGMTHDPGAASKALLGPTLLILGHHEAGASAMAEALATAEALPFPIGPFTQAYVHTYSAWFHELASEPVAAAAHAIRAIELAAEHGYSTWLGAATLHLAIANAAGDSPSDWIPLMECGLDMWAEAGARLFRPYFLFWLADARRRIGEHDRAVEALDEALEQVAGCDERFHESELHRLRGELLLASDPDRPEPAAAELSCAVTVARRQRARTFELRAMTALHRLEAGLGRGDRTAPSLAALVDSFGEARAFPDLVEARTALGRSPS